MIRFGQVTEIDPAKGLCRVNFQDDGIVSAPIPVLQLFSFKNKGSRVFDINEHVACLMDENCEHGVVLGAIYDTGNQPDGATADKLRVKFQDGASFEYDRSNGTLNIDGIKKLIVTAQTDVKINVPVVNVECQNATVKADATVTIDTPTTTVTGLLVAAAIQTQPGAGGSGKLTITGDVEVSGKIDAVGEVKSGSIGLTSHKHGGVQTGGGTTSTPVP
jgi:phage baseplate assembly protein V